MDLKILDMKTIQKWVVETAWKWMGKDIRLRKRFTDFFEAARFRDAARNIFPNAIVRLESVTGDSVPP